MKKLLLILLVSLFFYSCKKNNDDFESKTFIVAAEKTTCNSWYGTPHDCLQVKESENGSFNGFNDTIEGFNYIAGFEYTIEVKVYNIPTPPADASSKRYVFIRVISKK